ncbi:MAG TPA: hypothetical protein VF669_09365 [Tepidisphaeraceae bacterium]|jgi:hypothetical protein
MHELEEAVVAGWERVKGTSPHHLRRPPPQPPLQFLPIGDRLQAAGPKEPGVDR